MSERYTKLFVLPENQYTPGAPILIAAGALLKDNQTGKMLAQLKFRSLSPKEIKAVQISIAAFDVTGKEVKGVAEHSYLDLAAGRDATFGQKQAVPLPETVTRSIAVECTSVIFADGSVWEAPETAQWRPLPKQTDLTQQLQDAALVSQYRRDTSESAWFAVLDYEDLWLCACGAVNHSGERECHSCQQSKAALIAALDKEILKEHKAAHDQAEAERSIMQAEANKVRKAKARKIGIIAATAAIVVIAASILVTQVIVPSLNYNKAVSLMEDGKYYEAIAAFEALGDYKDAQEHSFTLWVKMGRHQTISAGFFHTVGLKSDGTVVAVGDNEYGQCDVSDWADIVAISAGDSHTVGLKSDGTVVAVGGNKCGQCDVSDWTDIAAISAGFIHTVGLKSDGTVVAVGDNEYGQCDVSDWTDIAAISAGFIHTVGLKSDGTVVAVGLKSMQCLRCVCWTNIKIR